MVRQILRLMRPIRTPDGHMMALAIYRVRRKGKWTFTPAKEKGYEGVACLDDVARAAWLFLDVWNQYRLLRAREYAEGFLSFVRAMQQPDGRFLNFVTNWQGTANVNGMTSHPDGCAWNARGVMALARSTAVLGLEGDLARVRLAWPHIKRHNQYMEIRALHVLAALELEQATGEEEWLRDIRTFSDEILECRDTQGRLLNERDAPYFHYWGHLQPAALALAGARLKWTPFVDAAEQSIRLLIDPLVRGGFALPQVLPYDVSSVIFSLKALYQVTLRSEYRDLLHLARAWFHGRNAAGQPVYDPQQGLCHDGIDMNHINQNSGAESNIEAAFALMEELPWPLLIGLSPETAEGDEEPAAAISGEMAEPLTAGDPAEPTAESGTPPESP